MQSFLLEENKDHFINLLNGKQTMIMVRVSEKVFSPLSSAGVKCTKVWWVNPNITSSIMNAEDVYSKVRELLSRGINALAPKDNFHPRMNKSGFVNSMFMPEMFVIKVKENGFVICDKEFKSYPNDILDNMILFNDEYETLADAAIANSITLEDEAKKEAKKKPVAKKTAAKKKTTKKATNKKELEKTTDNGKN